MRKLARFALPFAGAMALCQYALPPAWRLWCAVAALLAALAAALVGKRLRNLLLPSLLGLALGTVWYSGYAAWAYAPVGVLADTEETAVLTLADYPEWTDYGWRCTVRADGVRGCAVYYSDQDLSGWGPGDRFTGRVRWSDASDNSYYASRRIFLRAYGRGAAERTAVGGGELRYLLQRLARRLRQAVEGAYDAPERGLILALLTGERDGLDEQSLGDLEESGLLHITAVSGLHCGILLGALGCVLLRRRRLTALAGYPVLLLYAVMVGATPSVVRACVMAGFLLLGDLVEREADPLTSLSGAAVVILLANPFAIASYSFQLSFASVTGLLVVSPRLQRLLNGGGEERSTLLDRCRSLLTGTLSASLGAMAFTAPLSALYFGALPLLSVLSNLLVLWMLPVLFVGALALTPLAAAVPALGLLAELPALLARYVLWAAGLVAHLPGHAVYFTGLTALFWLAYVYAMVILCAVSRDRPRKYVLAAVLAVVSLAAAVGMPARAVADDALTAVAVDVGQGACTLLSSGGKTVLVDCGSAGSSSSRGPGNCAADVMASYGWRGLAGVVLTHYHEDHAGGLAQLLARVPVERLYLPQLGNSGSQSDLQAEVLALAERYGVEVSFIEEPGAVPLGEAARLTLYPPLTAGEVNEEGLTVLCTAGEFDLLITGDMASATEKLLVETYELPEVEVLLVGHHGSRYASSRELLKKAAPQVGIISVGENRYGHPTAEAMDRCVKSGMELYRTDLQGNIRIRVRH